MIIECRIHLLPIVDHVYMTNLIITSQRTSETQRLRTYTAIHENNCHRIILSMQSPNSIKVYDMSKFESMVSSAKNEDNFMLDTSMMLLMKQ